MTTPLTFISCNIEGHRHFDDRLLPFLAAEKPDVVCFQEVFEVDMPALSQALGMPGFFVPLGIIKEQSIFHEPLGAWGLAQFSRVPIIAHGFEYYVGEYNAIPDFDQKRPNSINRALSLMTVEHEGQQLQFATTHFTWTPDGSANDDQRQDLAAMEHILDARVRSGIVCGDFNAPRGGEIFAKLATRYTDNIPSHYTTSIDPNLHKAGALELMVDGLFSSSEYTLSEVKLVANVSDHQAIVAKVSKN